jgi:cell division protein FtsN
LISNASASDKLFRVQVGPYSDIKDAEVMRTKLVGDGYNPILKK